MTARFHQPDADFLQRALRLALRGEGRVEPNPMVGAVLVRNGRVLAEGWHRRFGGPHAEIEALRACAARHGADAARGATCYVTLEPCCHHGKTPPCTDALIAAGAARVVAAMRDPFPDVAGRGIRLLRRAGVSVEVGLLQEQAAWINRAFVHRVTTGRPWVTLKWAQSLDGKIATQAGASRWISSEASRREAHRLRGRMDAVIVGVGTVLADDPELTCRHVRPRRVATRVVLDSQLRTPHTAKLVRTARQTPTLIFTSAAAPSSRRRALERAGCELCVVVTSPIRTAPGIQNRTATVRERPKTLEVDQPAPVLQRRTANVRERPLLSLPAILDELGRRNMTNVLVEGGGRVLGSFFDTGLANEAVLFVAPCLIGGATAPGPLHGLGRPDVPSPDDADVIECRPCGPDRMWRLRLTAALPRSRRAKSGP